ncbi:MAG: ATP-binding protein [Oscillochloridaceae bacterium]|nr:ATP-binding protein [Chloroflexaceae bacterium]MDW8389251.1 ATP-binding protein [Oscillochloridaceae bacterium]
MRQFLNTYRSQLKYTVIGPYLALMILVMLVGSFIAITLVADSWQERFNNQLGQVARNFSESFAQREIGNLTFLSQIIFTAPNAETGAPAVPQAMRDRNVRGLEQTLEGLWQLAQVNDNVKPDRLIVFDPQGLALVDWERGPDDSGAPIRYLGTNLAGIPLVESVLRGESTPIPGTDELGDKFSGLVSFRDGEGKDHLHFFTVAPVYVSSRTGENELLVGGLLVAQRIDALLADLQQRSQSAISTIYDVRGIAYATTVAGVDLASLDMSERLLNQLRALNAPGAGAERARPASASEMEDPCLDIGMLSGRLVSPVETVRPPACSVNTVSMVAGREFQQLYAPLMIRGVQSGYFSVGLSTDFVVSAWSSSRSAVLGITAALALATVIVGVVVARRITRPLHNLVETAEAVTAGDLERRSTVTEPNELGRLALAFNQMTEHLLRLYVTSRELNRTIDIDQVLTVASEAADAFVPGTEAIALLATREGFGYRARPAAPDNLRALSRQLIPPSSVAALSNFETQEVRLLPVDSEVAQATGLAHAGLQTACWMPIFRQRQLAGALLMVHAEPEAFDESTRQHLAVVANMASAVLANALLYNQVQQDAKQRQAILASIGDGVVVCDELGRIIQLNRAAEEMLGLTDWRETRPRFDDLPLEPAPQSREVFGRSDPQFRLGRRFLTLTRSPLLADEGCIAGEVIVLHDVTEAVAIDKAKTDFIATISHELRTPLTVIRGFTELLLRGTGGEPPTPEQAELLEQVRLRAMDMTDMVNNAILIADIESGRLRTDLQPLDLDSVLNRALAPLLPAFEAKHLSVTVEIPPDLPPVLADREQLQRALGYLLDNARRYTDAGGVTIRAFPLHGQVQIDVIDTGQGIPTAMLPRLFSRFQRIEGNSSSQRGGGLGLAITRQLIERQGGTVRVDSAPGRGSTFSVTLQQANEQTLAVAQSNESTSSP